ncbi:hypothetical protein [Nostoc sp.]
MADPTVFVIELNTTLRSRLGVKFNDRSVSINESLYTVLPVIRL